MEKWVEVVLRNRGYDPETVLVGDLTDQILDHFPLTDRDEENDIVADDIVILFSREGEELGELSADVWSYASGWEFQFGDSLRQSKIQGAAYALWIEFVEGRSPKETATLYEFPSPKSRPRALDKFGGDQVPWFRPR